MKIRNLIGAGVLATLATASLAPSASAQEATTTVEFVLTTGLLSINTGDGVADFGTVDATLGEIVGDIDPTTVTDERNSTAGWVVSASSGAFDLDADSSGVIEVGEAAGDQIAPANVEIIIPLDNAVTATLRGAVTDLGTAFTANPVGTTGDVGGDIGSLDGADLVGLIGLGSSVNTLQFTPEVTVTIPGGAVEGTYIGVVTQTVI